jgi:pimeloyl-ACP methyl ester carboxylesterase
LIATPAFAALVAVNCFAWRPSGALFRGMLAVMGSTPARELDAAVGFLPRATATGFYAEVDTGLRGALSDLPLLTIFGERNDPLRFQPRWKALFPTAQQLTVRRGNHFPMCDDRELVAAAVKDFVTS